MVYIVYLILVEIIATIQASNPRSVNVALETVLEFNSNDDIEFIDTMQNFLNKLKIAINKNRIANNNETKLLEEDDTKKDFVFTDFLANTITVLKSYKDDDLKMFFNTLGREIKTWQTRKEFHEITDKLGFRRLIDRNLQSLKNSHVNQMRRKLNYMFDKLKFTNRNGNRGFVADFLNYIYKKESEAHLMNFLNNLKLYRTGTRRNNMTDLKRIIRHGIISVIDPLLKLNLKAVTNLNTVFHKYDVDNSTKYENATLKHVKPKNSVQKYKFKNVLKDNEILDYIEDHLKVIDKHLTTKRFKSILNSISTSNKYIHATKSKKYKKPKTKPTNLETVVIKQRKRNKQKLLAKDIKNAELIDDDRKPVLIKLSSNDDSQLKSVEEYLSSTTRLKRFKKSTRPKLTSRKSNVYKTTKKYRKAFRTSTLSVEGLSIEHFGSLFGREFHRKSNDNDTFVQTVLKPYVPTVPVAIISRDVQDNLSYEMPRQNNLTENKDYRKENRDGIEIVSENIKEHTEHVDEKQDLITESIKIKGNITIEKPTEATTFSEVETTSTPVQNTTYRDYNVSIITKYFNAKPLKPTIVLRRQDVEMLNETDVTPSTTVALQISSTLVQPTNATENISKTIIKNIKPNDGLENEIEGIMDKYNSTPIPVEFENLISKVQKSGDENNKVRDQMKADLAKLLAPPSTKSTVTELFTDPFDGIDDATDIL